jgi:hypothetical protein
MGRRCGPPLLADAFTAETRRTTMKTVIGLFDDFQAAQLAINGLLDRHFDRAAISVVANNVEAHYKANEEADIEQSDLKKHAMAESARTGAGAGALVGTGVGGVLGVLAGIGTIVIPGIGPIVAAGPLLTTLTGAGVGAAAGAALGGLVGALVKVGVPEHDAQFYSEAVRRGGIVVIVRAEDDAADTVSDILTKADAIDVDERRKHFESTGFTGYSAEARTFTLDDLTREREVYRSQQGQRTRGSRTFSAA